MFATIMHEINSRDLEAIIAAYVVVIIAYSLVPVSWDPARAVMNLICLLFLALASLNIFKLMLQQL